MQSLQTKKAIATHDRHKLRSTRSANVGMRAKVGKIMQSVHRRLSSQQKFQQPRNVDTTAAGTPTASPTQRLSSI